MGNMRTMPQGFQGLQVPVPDDDFEGAPTTHLVCRAASNPAPAGTQQMDTCAGERSQHHLQYISQNISRDTSNKSAGTSSFVHEVQTPTQEQNFATPHPSAVDGSALGAPGPEVVKIHGGGASRPPQSGHKNKAAMQNTFASTTECILQNLTMTVGNPSATTGLLRSKKPAISRITSNSQSWLISQMTGRRTPAYRISTMGGPTRALDNFCWMTSLC